MQPEPVSVTHPELFAAFQREIARVQREWRRRELERQGFGGRHDA